MRRTLRLAASLLATAALGLIVVATVTAANPNATYTCTKEKKNGNDVRAAVPESAVAGLTNAGFTCVADTPEEDEDEEQEDGQDEGQDEGEDGPGGGESEGDDSTPDPEEAPEPHASLTVEVETPSESRSLYCSTSGVLERAAQEGSGVALDLPDAQGALLVAQGLATPGIFYAGIGVSCDLLPGFRYSGTWVDHVGDVVPGVAVYPYFVPAAG